MIDSRSHLSCLLLVVTAASMIAVSGCRGEEKPDPITGMIRANNGLEQQRLFVLSSAVDGVESTLGSMQDSGYQRWIASETVPRLVTTLNASQQPLPGEAKAPGPSLTYVADRPTGPWQVVLRADDTTSSIVIKGYGESIDQPVYEKTIAVSPY